MPFAENLGSGGSALDAQYGSSSAPNTNAPLLLDPRTSGNFVYTPGSAGNYVSVPHADSLNILGTEGVKRLFVSGYPSLGNYASSPDVAALDITGDIDIKFRFAPTTFFWTTPVSPLGKYGGAGQRSWLVSMSSGQITLTTSNDGTATVTGTSTVAVPFTGKQVGWVRATLDVDDGAGNRVYKFYTSIDGTTWTQLGSTVTTAGTTSIFASTAPLEIASITGDSANRTDGEFYRVIVQAAYDTPNNSTSVVFDADFTQQTIGSRGFIENTGKLVSIFGAPTQIVDGTTYGFMPGVTGGWTTPDVAALDVSDLEITARLALNQWSGASAVQTVVAKWDGTSGSISYRIDISTLGRPTVFYSVGGVGQPGIDSGAAYPFTNGQTYWMRVRRIAATGVWRFYWAADSETEPTVWTNVGGDRPGTAGALDNSTALTTIGVYNNAFNLQPAAGRFFRAIIRNANTGGTKVLDADFTRQIQFASSFTEATGKVVTTVSAARIERARDLEIVTRVALDDWTPGVTQWFVGKWGTSGNQRAYAFVVNTVGQVALYISTTGSSITTPTTAASLSFANGAEAWLKATLDVDNGAGGYTATFYTSTDGVTWTLFGAPVVGTGSISIFPSTAQVNFGGYDTGVDGMSGKVYRTIIRNGINGPAVLDLDFTSAITTGSQSVIEPASGATIPQAVQFAPNLGTGGAALNARYGSAVGADTNDPLLLEHDGTNYLYLPGVSGNYASTPDAAALDITGDIDARVLVLPDDLVSSANYDLISKWSVAGSVSWGFTRLATGALRLYWSTNGTAVSSADSTAVFSFAASTPTWLRVTLDVSNPANPSNGYDVAFYSSADGSTWAQIGATVVGAASTSIFSGTSALHVGGNGLIAAGAMKVYRAQVLSGIGGTVVFDANFTTGITSGGQTSFTESSSNAATVTINRSTSGRKSVAVVRDVWSFGTDDYLEVPDDPNGLLDFGASDSFTVVAAVRQWGTTTGAVIAKTPSLGATLQGWDIYLSTGDMRGQIGDGTRIDVGGPTGTSGALMVSSFVRNTVADNLQVFLGTTAGTAVGDTSTGTLANADVMRVGRLSGAGTLYADMELLGGAIFRRALTASEIALVNTHYQTGPTAASNALLSESVWWIDAGRTAAAQINRSTTGRKSVACADCIWLLGVDDFFEVADNPLLDFDQGEDFTLMSLVRVWDFQGTNDTLMAKSSSTTTAAAGYGLASGATNPLTTTARLGDGSTGASVSTLARVPSRLVAVWAWRDTATGLLHIALNNDAGSSTADLTTGNSANSLALRLGRLAGTGTEYLDAEMKSSAIWRRKLTASERAAVNYYYGTV